ncbi:MAG: hypothetical protein IPL72_18055 [Sulfuritalea sp.]|nr:hypothetical protein [Sulfuritalea sp.]
MDNQLMYRRQLGIAPAGKALAYRVTDDERGWARGFLDQRRITAGASAGRPAGRRLSDQGLPRLAAARLRRCAARSARWPDVHFLIFGMARWKVPHQSLAADFSAAATLCAGRLCRLRQTAALMDPRRTSTSASTPGHAPDGRPAPPDGGALPRLLAEPRAAPLDHPCVTAIDRPLADRCTPEAPMADISVDTVWQAVEQRLTTSCKARAMTNESTSPRHRRTPTCASPSARTGRIIRG